MKPDTRSHLYSLLEHKVDDLGDDGGMVLRREQLAHVSDHLVVVGVQQTELDHRLDRHLLGVGQGLGGRGCGRRRSRRSLRDTPAARIRARRRATGGARSAATAGVCTRKGHLNTITLRL